MIFILLPMSVYTLFIMRMKPNNKQNTSGISNFTAKKVQLVSAEWSISPKLTFRGLSVSPSVHWVVGAQAVRETGSSSCSMAPEASRDSTSGSAVLPWAWIHGACGLLLLSRLYRPFKVPHATMAHTAVL